MGIMQRLGLLPQRWSPPPAEEMAGPIIEHLASQVSGMSVEKLWAEQPHLRTVVDFMARSVSSVSLHAYERQADGGRERIREGAIADLCRKANATQLTSEVIHRAVSDLALYDEWIWVLRESADKGPEILPLPPTWVLSKEWADPWTLKSITILDDTTGRPLKIPADRVIRQVGYDPETMKDGRTPIESLKDTLREQLESAAYRAQIWRRGPRASGVIERPSPTNGGKEWSAEARKRFMKSVEAWYSGNGSKAGGALLLEDGMQMKPFHLQAKDEQVVEMTKLSLQTVAGVFHINPTMVGLMDNANYSNVKEFRKSLYGDSLGPIVKRIEEVLNVFVLPALADTLGDTEGVYLEFNLDEKLRASFEEKAAVTSTAVGGPWMTANEARAMNNLPAVEGGDDLIRPLNVGIVGEEPPEEPPPEGPPPDDEPEDPGDDDEPPGEEGDT